MVAEESGLSLHVNFQSFFRLFTMWQIFWHSGLVYYGLTPNIFHHSIVIIKLLTDGWRVVGWADMGGCFAYTQPLNTGNPGYHDTPIINNINFWQPARNKTRADDWNSNMLNILTNILDTLCFQTEIGPAAWKMTHHCQIFGLTLMTPISLFVNFYQSK